MHRVKYYPYLESVRRLWVDDIFYVLDNTPRPLGNLVRVILLSDLPSADLLPGSGFFIVSQHHCYALWRGLDEEYFFFDSLCAQFPPQNVFRFLHGKQQAHRMNRRVQASNLGTCGYHCVDFLDFVSSNLLIPTAEISLFYPKCSVDDVDVAVVKNFEKILSEFPNNLLLKMPFPSEYYSQYSMVQTIRQVSRTGDHVDYLCDRMESALRLEKRTRKLPTRTHFPNPFWSIEDPKKSYC